MAGTRPFDDARFPDQEGFAECFLCGRKVDPLDPMRGRYTPNANAFDGLPAHLACLEVAIKNPIQLEAIALKALNEMGDVQMKRQLRAADLAPTNRAEN